MQIIRRKMPGNIGLLLHIPFFNVDAVFGDMFIVLQPLDGRDEILHAVFCVVDGAVFEYRRRGRSFQETGNGVQVGRIGVMEFVCTMGVFQMENDHGNDIGGIGDPVIGVFFAFIIGDDIRDVLGCRNFFGRADPYLVQRVPAGAGAVCTGRLKLDDSLAHFLSISGCDSPVFRFDIVDDDRFFPASQKRWHDDADTFPGSGRGDEYDVPALVIPQVKVREFGINPKGCVIQAFPKVRRRAFFRLICRRVFQPAAVLSDFFIQGHRRFASWGCHVSLKGEFGKDLCVTGPFFFQMLVKGHFTVALGFVLFIFQVPEQGRCLLGQGVVIEPYDNAGAGNKAHAH